MKFGRFACQLRHVNRMVLAQHHFLMLFAVFFNAASSRSGNEEINKQNKRPVFCFHVWIDEQIVAQRSTGGKSAVCWSWRLCRMTVQIQNKKKHQDPADAQCDDDEYLFFIWCQPQIDSIPQKERKRNKKSLTSECEMLELSAINHRTTNNNKVKTADATAKTVGTKKWFNENLLHRMKRNAFFPPTDCIWFPFSSTKGQKKSDKNRLHLLFHFYHIEW